MPKKGEEKCQRCGEYGYDRRTLHMSCFYQMDELGLPFGQYQVMGEATDKVGKKEIGDSGIFVTEFAKPTGKKNNKCAHRYYTLRVCKDCRALWMQAIKDWFENGPKEKEPSCGSGIFVRRNGTNVEITEEEWYLENPGREPYRVPRLAGEQ